MCEMPKNPQAASLAFNEQRLAQQAQIEEQYRSQRDRNLGQATTGSASSAGNSDSCQICSRRFAASRDDTFNPGCAHWFCTTCASKEVAKAFGNSRSNPFQTACSACSRRYGIDNCIRLCLGRGETPLPADVLSSSVVSGLRTFGDLANELSNLRKTVPTCIRPSQLTSLAQVGYELTKPDATLTSTELATIVSEEVRGIRPAKVKRSKLLSKSSGRAYRYIGERHYNAVSQLVAEEVYKMLVTECGLVMKEFTNDETCADQKEGDASASDAATVDEAKAAPARSSSTIRTRLFYTPDWFTNTKGALILAPGGAGVQACLWARSLAVYDSLEAGTMLPFVRHAREVLGLAVLVLNPNENGEAPRDASPEQVEQVEREQEEFLRSQHDSQPEAVPIESPAERWWTGQYPNYDERTRLQREYPPTTVKGHETPDAHFRSVFAQFVEPTQSLRRTGIDAHSASGSLVLRHFTPEGSTFAEQSLRCLIFTDSVHTMVSDAEVVRVGATMMVDAINFTRSVAELGSISPSGFKGLPLVASMSKSNRFQPLTILPDECWSPSEEQRKKWIQYGSTTPVPANHPGYEEGRTLIDLGAVCLSSGVSDHALTNVAAFPFIVNFLRSRVVQESK